MQDNHVDIIILHMNINSYAINITMMNVDIIDLSLETQRHTIMVCWTLHFFPSMIFL